MVHCANSLSSIMAITTLTAQQMDAETACDGAAQPIILMERSSLAFAPWLVSVNKISFRAPQW